jgi:hypothetical protein
MIIGVSGKAGSGKTTLATVAEEEFGFKRISFGGILKTELIEFLRANEFVFKDEHFYMTTREKNILIPVPTFVTGDDLASMTPFIVYSPTCHCACISYRSLMQWYGDKTRAINKDYWLQRFMDTTDFSEDIIVDDVRFTHEAALLQALGALIVRINWPTMASTSQHISETNLDKFPMFHSVIDKEHGISLTDFTATCREHMKLWTGALDEPTNPAELDS